MFRPCGYKLAPSTLQAVIDRIDAGLNDTQIHAQTGVSRGCTARKRRNIQQWGHPYAPPCVTRGRPATLSNAQRRELTEYLHSKPQAYLEEIKDWLLEDFNISLSISSISRELKKMRWSRKVATKRAAEQSDALRRVFQARVQTHYTADQIIAIDESACNERTGDRKYGWGPIGHSVELVYSIKRSERWSLLPAMSVRGYLAHRVYQGGITAAVMEDFLRRDVLPLCTPGYHVLVMDNASIHRSPEIVQACKEFGVALEYLPPYSPDYNPIERSFKVLKSWIKRYSQQQEEWQDFRFFLEVAVVNSCYNIDCSRWFTHCGYLAAANLICEDLEG
jgi:transposase